MKPYDNNTLHTSFSIINLVGLHHNGQAWMWGQVHLMLVAIGQLIQIMSKVIPDIFPGGSWIHLRHSVGFWFKIQLIGFPIMVKNEMLLFLTLNKLKPWIKFIIELLEMIIHKFSLFSTN